MTSAGCIDTEAHRLLATEVLTQAVRDYWQLKEIGKDQIRWCGIKHDVSKEVGLIEKFFTGGTADLWLGFAGINCDGIAIWRKISQDPSRRVSDVGGSMLRIHL